MGTGHDDAAEPAGIGWQRLHQELTAWLVQRFRPGIDAANVAGDAVLLALRRFGRDPKEASGRIWRWLCRTAENLVFADHRKTKRCTIVFTNESDFVASALGVDRTASDLLVEHMLATAHGVEREVVRLLRAGCPTNQEMAAAIQVEPRTIERARYRLRRQFAELLEIRRTSVGLEHL